MTKTKSTNDPFFNPVFGMGLSFPLPPFPPPLVYSIDLLPHLLRSTRDARTGDSTWESGTFAVLLCGPFARSDTAVLKQAPPFS